MPPRLPYTPETASQTAGPFVHIGLAPSAAGLTAPGYAELGRSLAPDGVPGPRLSVEGMVLDGAGAPVTDALIEIWHPDAEGRWADGRSAFRGWGRVSADPETGAWAFETVRPGPSAGHDGVQAPHMLLWILARGINIGLLTRLYLPDADNAADPVLGRVEPHRRATLIAKRLGPGRYRFVVRLQGEDETVFFDM